jgi:heat shock protein HslJ
MRKLSLLVVFFYLTVTSCTTTKPVTKIASIDGTWMLNYITGPRIAFDGLYPNKKPTIVFDLKENKIYGNNSCNQYFGTLILDGAKINFKDSKIGMTMMACVGNGDSVYMDTLAKIESYTITDDGKTLNFLLGDVVMMRYTYQK